MQSLRLKSLGLWQRLPRPDSLEPLERKQAMYHLHFEKMNVMKWMKLLKRMDVMNVIVRNRWCKALDSFFVAAYTLDLLREDKSSRAHRNSGAFFAIQRHQLPRHNVQTMAKAKALTPFIQWVIRTSSFLFRFILPGRWCMCISTCKLYCSS